MQFRFSQLESSDNYSPPTLRNRFSVLCCLAMSPWVAVAEQRSGELRGRRFIVYLPVLLILFLILFPNAARYGVEAHLFLCSEFCTPQAVIEKMDRWEAWHEERSVSDFQFKHTAGLDQVYGMNLEMNLIKREKNFSAREMNDWLAANLGPTLAGPPSADPSHGRGGAKPPTMIMMEMESADSTPTYSELLTSIPVIDQGSVLHNPVRKSALRAILRSELLSLRSEGRE